MDAKITLTLEEYKKFEKTEKELDECRKLIDSIIAGKTVTIKEGRGPFGYYQRELVYNPDDIAKEHAINKALIKTIKEVAFSDPLEVFGRIKVIRNLINTVEEA